MLMAADEKVQQGANLKKGFRDECMANYIPSRSF